MTPQIKSWHTTIVGIGMILSALGVAITAQFDTDPLTVIDWAITIPAIIAGVGFILAKDGGKTSEQVGIKT